MLKKGWDLYLQEKMYCLTVRITRLLNLNKFLFLYFPNKTDCISNEICISNILKIHFSILHHKSFTIGHLKNRWSVFSISVYKKYKGENLLSLICIDNHFLKLFYEDFETVTIVILTLLWI